MIDGFANVHSQNASSSQAIKPVVTILKKLKLDFGSQYNIQQLVFNNYKTWSSVECIVLSQHFTNNVTLLKIQNIN